MTAVKSAPNLSDGEVPTASGWLDRTFHAFLELFRNNDAEWLCAKLVEIGIDATVADRGRLEEKSGSASSGLVDIATGPIRWVNVRHPSESPIYIDFGIPVLTVPNLKLRSIRIKAFRLFGAVVGVRWEDDADSKIAAQLSGCWRALETHSCCAVTRGSEPLKRT